MTGTIDARAGRRFLRTLRVATQTALAGYHLGERPALPATRFQALAAKTRGPWRFPDGGLVSGDGLLIAQLHSGTDRMPQRLVVQALGSAGLSVFAGRAAELTIAALTLSGAFDRDGRLEVELVGLDVGESDLADFGLRLLDASP